MADRVFISFAEEDSDFRFALGFGQFPWRTVK